MIELTVLNDNNVDLNTVDDGLIGLDVVMATGGGSAPTLQTKSVTYTPTESAQTSSVLPDVGYDGLSEVDVTVGAIDSEYVGSDVPRKSSSDLTASGATVNVPAGYYSASASKSVASGTEGTPTATKGAVSNHAVSVTPSVTNSAGYISGGTKTGSAVSVSASELVSGTKSISANGTDDVTNYASVSVSVPNSYSASDEGKVVDNGALVSQTSATYTANDTYDTTLINEVTVNVSGGSPTLITKTITEDGTYNASSDNADGYSSVIVKVDEPTPRVLTNSWDFTTQSLVDSVGGLTATLNNSPTLNSSGVTITGASQYITFPLKFVRDKTYEIDFGTVSKNFSSGHGRVFCVSNTDQGFIWNSGGYWSLYWESIWQGDGGTDSLSNCTLRITTDLTFARTIKGSSSIFMIPRIYKDGVLWFVAKSGWTNRTSNVLIGSSSNSYRDMTIKAFRVYDGTGVS